MSRSLNVSRTRWSAAGAALAVALGSGALTFVDAGSTASSFVPITPCRLIDTRSTSPVGPRNTPIHSGESLTVQVTGSNGSCVIPASATAIVINVTAVGPTAAGYITLYPSDVALPNASNLNFTANQNPTPNLVTVSLSAGGAVNIFNAAGDVNVLGDIAGYYQPDNGTANAGAPCKVGGLDGVIVNGYDFEHNVSSKCFTRLVSILAGSGAGTAADGIGLSASFNNPEGIAVDSVGNIYVADYNNHRIRKITTDGVVTTLAGSTQGTAIDGTGSAARFDAPYGVAVDSVGNVYVADTGNHRIRKITPDGVVTTIAGDGISGSDNGAAATASFNSPEGIAVDAAGNIYVGDTGNNRIRKITAGTVSTLAGSTFGFAEGTGGAARFSLPVGVTVDSAGNVYVADSLNERIRKITPAGLVTTLAGGTMGSADGTGLAAQFATPTGVAVDAYGNVFVAEFDNGRIRKVTPAGVVTTVAGSSSYGVVDGIGTAAQFAGPTGIAVDAAGTLYIAEYGGYIRRIN